MIISIFSLLLAAIGYYYSETLPFAGIAMLLGGSLVGLILFIIQALHLIPLETLEQKLVPNLMELYRKSRRLQLGMIWLLLFILVSYAFAIFAETNLPYREWFFPVWIVAFGISLDVLKGIWRATLNFLNPYYLINLFARDAKKAIQDEKDEVLWSSLDSLSEIALRSVEKSKIALSHQTLQNLPPILQTFFDSSKSISRINLDKKTEKDTGSDEASYTLFYLLQKLELINDRALQNRLEAVCRQMVIVMGKIILSSARFDLTMVSFPTHFLTKFGLKAQQHHFDEVAVLTTSTLLEIAKTILTDMDLNYAELQEPFQAIINGLDAIARGTFKKDKNTNIQLLIQPLKEIRALLETDKMEKHPDTPGVLAQIDRSIEEFTALEQVMRTIPPLPGMNEIGESP
ncbi:MAG: hypothetical protein LW832_07800 [Parachlamydia sp.]|jgi:hypothetical protein|nr:hypothetical protein [Parachlamydia sp.]